MLQVDRPILPIEHTASTEDKALHLEGRYGRLKIHTVLLPAAVFDSSTKDSQLFSEAKM